MCWSFSPLNPLMTAIGSTFKLTITPAAIAFVIDAVCNSNVPLPVRNGQQAMAWTHGMPLRPWQMQTSALQAIPFDVAHEHELFTGPSWRLMIVSDSNSDTATSGPQPKARRFFWNSGDLISYWIVLHVQPTLQRRQEQANRTGFPILVWQQPGTCVVQNWLYSTNLCNYSMRDAVDTKLCR